MKKRNQKGFTLAELLIVVAIIAVLVAISIPIFSTQLEKSREATDAANIRSAYAEAVAARISGDDEANETQKVDLKQQTPGWQNEFDFPDNLAPTSGASQPTKQQKNVEIKATDSGATVSILLAKQN